MATVIFICIMAGAGYFVYTRALSGGTMVKVPDVVGYPITDAANILREQGLEMAVLDAESQVPHPSVPKYHIISQRPNAGQVVRAGHKIRPLVSLGPGYSVAPDVTQKTLEEARTLIEQARFRSGTIARVYDNAPRDTVISQDPPPKRNIPNNGEIHLLVSAGKEQPPVFMPDLRGKPVSEIERIMAPYRVNLVPEEVVSPDVMPDVVLNQNPPPFALIYEGQIVTYQVKRSGNVAVPDAWQETPVRHLMPYDWYDKEVRVDLIDRMGNRTTITTWPPMFDDQSKASRVAGSTIRLPVSYVEEARVEVFVNGAPVEVYVLKAGAEPVRASESPL